jgi:hypothetical protein
MLVEIEITNTDIAFAENILFPHGEKFDDERIAFIKNLDSVDLQAVPGSGKTTALMAKLLILERYLPFVDGSGVLVISHTNAAIDEIKSKIGKYCPKLFSFPNFVGTIQKFTNEFLTIPFYLNTYNKKPYYIDGEIYSEYTKEFSSQYFSNFKNQEENNAKRYLRMNDLYKKVRYSHLDGVIVLTDGYNGRPLDFKKPRGNTCAQNYRDWTDQEKQRVKSWLFEFKRNLLRRGILCFDDAYCLAFEYLYEFPRIKLILQKRFRYVFVDEMQDMEKHQHDLLEIIFFDDANSVSKYQRIGDKNQAIYNKVSLDEVWSERETLTINGSHRLTRPIAELVNCFALHRDAGFQVKGLRKGDIPPHLILYDDINIKNVIREYSRIIDNFLSDGKIPRNESIFKAIAWRKYYPGENKIYIGDYFPGFDTLAHDTRIDHLSLEDYLRPNSKSKNSLAPIQTNIVNALLRVLQLENIKSEQERKYTKYSLFAYLKVSHEPSLDEFRLNLFQWSMEIAQGKDITNFVRAYIPVFLALFESKINQSNDFINKEVEENNTQLVRNEMRKINTANYHGFDIDITTIHAEKGKTHTATLYLETYYRQDGQGENAKSYESQRLCEQFKGENIIVKKGKHVKESAKMMYVGISRSTHLLCIAVHKDRFDKYLLGIDAKKWVIQRL